MPIILVTGATGRQGGAVAPRLLADRASVERAVIGADGVFSVQPVAGYNVAAAAFADPVG